MNRTYTIKKGQDVPPPAKRETREVSVTEYANVIRNFVQNQTTLNILKLCLLDPTKQDAELILKTARKILTDHFAQEAINAPERNPILRKETQQLDFLDKLAGGQAE